MSKKRRNWTSEFKTKVVLEVLSGEKTLSEIASKYEILPKSIQTWKNQFLSNASLAFDKSAVVKEYKEEIKHLHQEKDKMAKKLGEVIVERDWALGKLKSLDLSIRKSFLEREGEVQAYNKEVIPSLNKRLKLLGISKTAYYYKPIEKFSSAREIEILNMIDMIYTKYPYYGTRRVCKLLERLGFKAGRKFVKRAFEFMGIKALYPKVKTSISSKEHKKYPYLLCSLKNNKGQVIVEEGNKVWSGDITYIKLEKGYAYLSVIIDWWSKKILSWKLSNSMDSKLTTEVLDEALCKYPKPEIFNSDQGCQYTSQEHVQKLIENNISISMDGKGRSIDNIAVERFFRTLKYENVYPSSYKDISEARKGIEEYINIYNTQRLHSSLSYLTPDEKYYQGLEDKYYDAKKIFLNAA